MRRNGKNIICLECGNSFYVIKARFDTAKYCSNTCRGLSKRGIPTWGNGKTYEEMYGDKADEIRKKVARPGKLNGMYGKTHTKKSRQNISKNLMGTVPWNKGKKFPGSLDAFNRTGKNNAYIKYILRTENITYDQYIENLSEFVVYRNQVTILTRLQPLYLLENIEKRGKDYQLDHMISVKYGFDNNIPPELISDINNLRVITTTENAKKGKKNEITNANSFLYRE